MQMAEELFYLHQMIILGTIYKINSTNELRETFAVRMEQFGQLAIQMNDALKVQKNWRNEKDSAAKKCRLFENKVTADLRASVTDALIKKTPTMLCSYIGTLFFMRAYC